MIGYRPSMLRGMDVFPTVCYYDTWDRGRAMVRHAPQVFMMTMVEFMLGGDRYAVTTNLRFYMWLGRCSQRQSIFQ